MSDCIFCKILDGEIPSQCVYEDENVFAFRDINPQAPVHILVIPREHISGISEITPENSGAATRCLEAIAKIADREGFSSGYRVISNCGADAGQTVFHLHFHILAGKKLGETLV